MLRHKNISRVCCVILVLTLLVSTLFMGAAATGHITENTTIGYETRLFDQSRVHTIDIVMDDWDAFLETCTSEVYTSCHLVIDGESYKNVGIRGKGNTSLSSVAAFGNNRYSFKVEFDQYQNGMSYHGLDKLSLNNLIQDNTYMKDYFAYTLMNKMGVAAPLCSFVQINVNGEPWGLYLAVEGVEDAFLQRNYGKDHGELYKPDALSMGGGRGNGEDFSMDDFTGGEGGDGENTAAGGDDSFGGSAGGSSGDAAGERTRESASTPEPTADATPEVTATPAPAQDDASAGDAATMAADAAASTGDAASAGTTAADVPADAATMPADADAASTGDAASAGTTAADVPADAAATMPADADAASTGDAASAGTTAADVPADAAADMPADADAAASTGDAASAGTTAADMPTDAATMPAAAAATEAPAASAAPEAPAATGDEDSSFGGSSGDAATEWSAAGGEMPAAGGDMPAMDFGGGFGFGSSSDVKLQYSDDNPSSYSNIFNNAKTDITEADQTRLIASLKALSQRDVSVVDTESVINYMAVHNFLCNGDSYTGMMVHNYYLYEEDGVLSMIPWDYNLGYGGFSGGTGTSVVNTSISQLVSNSTGSDRPMAYWIMASDEYMAEYYAAYQEFIDTVFASGWFEQEIDRVIAMIDPYVKEDPTAFCTYEEFLKGSETLKNFCIKRAQSVQNQLDGNNTQVDGSDLDIASMGNMDNGGGGGGFNMPSRSGDEASTEGGDVTAAEGGNTAQAAADDASAGSSGGQAATEEAPAADPAVTEEAPAADPAATGDAPDADPAATEENPDAAAAEAERTRPASRTSSTSRTSTDTWTWLIICLAALVVALIIAKCFRTNR